MGDCEAVPNTAQAEEKRMWHRFGQGFDQIILRAVDRADFEGERDLSSRHLLWALSAEGRVAGGPDPGPSEHDI